MNNKKAVKSVRLRWALSLLVVLAVTVGFVPALRARAASLSQSTLSGVARAYRLAGSYRLVPRAMAAFAPDDPEPDPGPNPPPFGADLYVIKTTPSENVTVGSDVTYTIEVHNNGPDDAFNLNLTDKLPQGMTFVSFSSPAGWSCSTPLQGEAGDITCSASSLAVNAVASFTLTTHIASEPDGVTFYTNIATITSDTVDTNDENNSGSANSNLITPSTDVWVTKTTTVNTVKPDSDVTYTIEVHNGGSDAAQNVVLEDTLPGTMTLVSFSQQSGPTFNCDAPAAGAGGTISCKLASLPANSAAVFKLVGHIPADAAVGTEFTNAATVNTDTEDVSDENNRSQTTVTVATCDAELIVTTNADGGAGSLRQSISDVCAGGTIYFDQFFVSNIKLTSGELLIDKNLTIQGTGANRLLVGRDPASASVFRVFNIAPGANVTIRGLTISNGQAPDTGGGIRNSGTLVLQDSIVSGNHADTGSGGGVFNQGTMTIINSAIVGNTASNSGGVETVSGSLFIINSTISSNSATAFGGGIQPLGGFVSLTNVTVTNNHADANNDGTGFGGGVMASTGITLNNTIVAGNYRGSGTSTPDDIQGNVAPSSSFNLVGTGGNGGLTIANGNQVNVANPGLGALANNGGTTPTHALLTGSPALDAGSNSLLPSDTFDVDGDGVTAEPLSTDQRGAGYLRVADSADANTTQTVDIGAYEAQVSVEDIANKSTNEDTPLSFSFNVGDASIISTVTATSSNTTLVPNSGLSITGSGSTRTLQITPAADLSGSTTITVTVTGINSQTSSDSFVLNVTAVNDAPQAKDDSYSTSENTPLNVAAPGVLANDTDIDNSTLKALVVSNPSNGTLALNQNGSFLYTPNAGFSGTDSFTYKANDGELDSNVATVTISVNEGGTLQFNSATYGVNENAGSIAITITRTGGTAGTATVLFETSDGTATSSDYTTVSQTVTFADGEASKTVNVPVTNDSNDEADDTVNLKLSNAGGSGQLGTPSSAVLTITDDDNAPGISVNDVSVTEGNSGTVNAVFTVTLAASSDFTVKVDFATADGTATVAGSDYQSNSGTLTFNPGDVSKTVTVLVNGDTASEPNETFFVNLSNPQNTTITDNQGQGTILNDDSPGVQFSSNSYSFSEGAGHGDIIVNRVGDTSQPLTVEYITSDQSGTTPCQTLNTGIASDRCDYGTAAGTLRFAAGQSSLTIPLIMINDAYVEGDEQLSIKLSNPTGGSLGSVDTATVTITDNDTQTATANPIDDLDFFIRQLYLDFLGREPEAAGLQFWKSRMSGACPAGQVCDRIDTALKFFNSDEFRERGYLVYLFYHASLGTRPTYRQWILDVSKLNGFKTVAEQEAAKEAFINEFMSRQEFMNIYNGAQTGQAFVDALIQKSGVTPASRQALIDNYNTVGRARTLRAFLETPEVQAAFVDRAFVSMLYFGFLRRDPEDGGFNFWMQKLNDTNKDYRFLVGGFMQSDEYRYRFAQTPKP